METEPEHPGEREYSAALLVQGRPEVARHVRPADVLDALLALPSGLPVQRAQRIADQNQIAEDPERRSNHPGGQGATSSPPQRSRCLAEARGRGQGPRLWAEETGKDEGPDSQAPAQGDPREDERRDDRVDVCKRRGDVQPRAGG